MADNVNHPAHYTDGKYETIEFIERNLFDYHDGNAIKYISRAGKKDPNKMIEDLEKAKWYIHRANNKLDYDEKAITVYDYILDKKLSPELAAVVALIETSCYDEAEKMLDATIEDLKEKEKPKEINIGTKYCCDDYTYLESAKLIPKEHHFGKAPWFGNVICVKTKAPHLFEVGKMYYGTANHISSEKGNLIFLTNITSVDNLNERLLDYAKFIEFKGEA